MANINPKIIKPASPQILIRNPAIWHPDLFPKQLRFFEDETRFRLASGPRYCGKSRAVYHTILRHAWGTKNCRIAIIAKSVRNAKVGVWGDITSYIIQEWFDAKLEGPNSCFEWVKEPAVDGSTRMHYFRIRNYYGGVSEVQLHSLDFDGDVAAKLMNTSFSMIYFSELQNFEDPDVFRISILQLRMDSLPYHKHVWMADTNPPDSGTDHFAYKMWYALRNQEVPPETCQTLEQIADFRSYQAQFGLHEFQIDDNIYADRLMVRDLKSTYESDPVGWNRFILGKWEKAYSSKEYHFSGIFKPEIHVAGDVSAPNPDNWDVLKPTADCSELLTGWDLGDVNHAFCIWEPVIMENDKIGFIKLFELVWIGTQEPLTDFIFEALEAIEKFEKMCSKKVEWRHWSDTSSWRFSARAEDHDAVMIDRLSDGKVTLLAATRAKTHQSVRRRIKMYQDLLREDRILISAQCKNTIDMFQNLRSGRMENEAVSKGSPQKHCFDADTYMLFSEIFCQASTGPVTKEVKHQFVTLNF